MINKFSPFYEIYLYTQPVEEVLTKFNCFEQKYVLSDCAIQIDMEFF